MKILNPIIIIGLVLLASLMITQSNIRASSSVELSIPPGWNLISVPFPLVDDGRAASFRPGRRRTRFCERTFFRYRH